MSEVQPGSGTIAVQEALIDRGPRRPDPLMMPLQTEIPYRPDSSELFEAVSERPWAMFLDSGSGVADGGRYDIIVADPMRTIVTRDAVTQVEGPEGTVATTEEPFAVLRRELGRRGAACGDLPFNGGALGYFSYDLGRRLEGLPEAGGDELRLPQMAVGIYDWAVVVDHRAERSWLVGAGRDPATAARWDELKTLFSAPGKSAQAKTPLRSLSPVRSNLTRQAYQLAFERIQRYLREGDCYQVNFAQRFSVAADGDPWSAYRIMRRANPTPFAAYLNLPFGNILSASPERFIRVHGEDVQTSPIKGTRRRDADPELDERLLRDLRESTKDRAENLMIVDLLRNDLGKTCRPGTIRVPELFAVQSFATVHHLVSRVTGRLSSGKDSIDVLRACFPGGSITGAPKRRAMEIIDELEPDRRSIYCGAIGYVDFNGNMDTNIAIRTLAYAEGRAHFWAGGGIVVDSDAEAEYQETLDKASAFLRFFSDEALS